MSSPEEETFEEFLEKHNQILEVIRNAEPVVNPQIEPHWVAPYQSDQTFGILNPPEKTNGSLPPDDGTGGDRFPDAEEFINQRFERQRSTPSKHGFVNLPAEHNNRLAPYAAFNDTGNHRSLERTLESGTPTFQPPKTSKRSERLANLERQVGPGRLGANGLAKGLVRSHTPGITEWWSQDMNAWIPAIYHENLRPSLLAEASQLGKYEYPRAKGNDQFDETSFLLDQQYWAPDRENGWYQIKDHVLFRFQRDGYPVPQGEVEIWYYQGRIVLDMDNHPVKKYSNIPACCSSDMEGWLMEAISRLDGRITQADFRARMPSTRTTNTGEIKPLFALTALGMRMNRFRDEYSCPAWNSRTGGEKIKEWFWNRMSQGDRRMRMTCGLRKLTELELVELRALNRGTHPERAGRNALTSEERSKRSAEAEKKLQLKYGEQATEVLTGSKRKRYEAAVPGFGDCQPAVAAKRVKTPNHFPNNEEVHRYQWNPYGELYGQPYNFCQDVSNSKRKHADTVEKSDDEEPTESSKRRRSHRYLHQHSPSGYHVTNGTTTEQSSLSRHGTYDLLGRNLNQSSQSSLQSLAEYGQPGTKKGKRALESLPRGYGTTPMESNLQYQTQYSSHGLFTAETHGPQLYPSSRYEQPHSAQGNHGRGLYKRTADASGSPYETTEQPISDTQGSYVDSYGFDDLNLPLHTYEVPYPISNREASTSKRKRDEVIEESDSGEDISLKLIPKRQKTTPSDKLSGKSTYSQPIQRKRSIGLKIHTRVSSAGNAFNNVNPARQPSSDADLQRLRNVREPVVLSDEVEVINKRPVSIRKPLADQSGKATPQDYAIKNAEPLPSGAVDFRFVEPRLEGERESIALALGYTRSEYICLMKEEPPQTSTGESYATQHAEIQAALAARWVAPEPVPQLVHLGAWSTAFAHFPFPDIELSSDQQEDFAQICKEAVLGFFDPAHQTAEENLQFSIDQQLPVGEEEPDSLFEGDTLVANPEDELDPEQGRDEETDLSPLDRLKKENIPISDGSQLPVIDDETDSFNSLFDGDTLVADPEHEPKPKEGQGEKPSASPQAAIENQDELDSLFEDDTLIADPEDEPSPEEGQHEKSDTNPLDALTGQADELAGLFPELEGLTTQFTYEELMGVELPPLTEEEMRALDSL